MASKKAYQEKMESQLRKWTAKIDSLKAKADRTKAEARIKYHGQIIELRIKQELARQRLHELKESGDEAWEELKAGVDKALEDLKDALSRAVSRFKEK